MTKFRRLHLKNDMLAANFLANFIGVFLVNGLLILAEGKPPVHIWTYPVAFWVDVLFTPFAFIFVTVATLVYEKPIRQCLNAFFTGQSATRNLQRKASRRLLNEPFVLIILDLSM